MSSPIPRPLEATPTAAAAHSLPAWVYRHPEMARLEYERILKPSWQIACHISQIPRAGDYVTFELGGDSVIVLREPGGAIRALSNVCRHRGTRLLEGSGRCPGRITCPYHGWTYRYDGSLLATPARESFPDLDLRERCMIIPTIVMAVVMGVAPNLFLRPMAPSVERLLERVSYSAVAANQDRVPASRYASVVRDH